MRAEGWVGRTLADLADTAQIQGAQLAAGYGGWMPQKVMHWHHGAVGNAQFPERREMWQCRQVDAVKMAAI